MVAKRAVGDPERPYTPGDDTGGAPFSRFCSDAAGCEVLGGLGLGPQRIGADPTRGVFVMEDLGAGPSLADLLTGDGDPDAAVAALEAYVRSLARMHRATRGRRDDWDAARRALGGYGAGPVFDPGEWDAAARRFRDRCASVGATVDPDVDTDFERIGAALGDPGDWLAFTPSDCCPDNHVVRGETVAFFDCEFAAFRHALLDLAYVVVPFPTCWCAARLPDGLPERLVALYRGENDGPDFDAHLDACLAFWTVHTLSWTWTGDWISEDGKWGISTHRQRAQLRVANFLASSATLPGLARTVAGFGRRIPPPETPVPLYPVFRR